MRIQTKLFATFLLSAVFLTLSLLVFIQWSIGKGMIEYVNAKQIESLQPAAQQLVVRYQQNGSWREIENNPRLFFDIIRDNTQPDEFERKRPRRPHSEPPPPRRSRDANRAQERNGEQRRPPINRPGPPIGYALEDANGQLVAGRLPKEPKFNTLELILESQIIGYLHIPRRNQLVDGYELSFVQQQNSTLIIFAVLLLVVTLVIALPLARHIVRPIKQLTSGMHELTQGKFDRKLTLRRNDEFKQLEQDYNELAKTLKENESARKRWLADVSHELRTPVAILKGEIEAVIDGIRPLSLEHFESAQEEIKQLERLIEDLHELTRADIGTLHYQKQPMDVIALINDETQKFLPTLSESNIQLSLNSPSQPIIINADARRLKQLVSNLITNVIRYAQGAKELRVTIEFIEAQVIITFEDDGPGVDSDSYDKLFEHLFRAEKSRSRDTGGSGLGLAICEKIVKAHNGDISAHKSTMGGLAIKMRFPVDRTRSKP